MLKNKSFNTVSGSIAESQAVDYVKNTLKFKILETNHKNKIGEIDIIALDKKTIVFIEVKYSSSKMFGLPRERVNFYKQNKIRQVALAYLKMKSRMDSAVRFDVIDIVQDEISYIENAFLKDFY